MPPRRTRTNGALSTYDREILRAITDRRLNPADPEAQAVLQRVNAPKTDEVWLSIGGPHETPPAVTPPPQSLHTGEVVERAHPDPVTGGFHTRRPDPDPVSEQEGPLQRNVRMVEENVFEPVATTLGSLGRGAWEHVIRPAWDVTTGIATHQVGRNPYPQELQDRLREEGLPTDPRIEGPWGALEAATGAIPATAGLVYDVATGADPAIPDLVHDPPTWERALAERGAPTWGQNIGTVGDLLFGPEDLFAPGASAVAGLAVPVGRALSKVVKGATAADTLIPTSLRGLKNVLDSKDWNTFRRAVERTPEAKRPLSMLLPSEVGPLTRSAQGVTRFADTYNRLPDANYLAAAIRRGAPKRGWYANSRQALTEILGEDADMFTGLLAAMSPQTSVESNLTNALNTFVNWRAAGRPTGEQDILEILGRSVQGGTDKSVLEAWAPNSVRVLQGGQSVSGPKIDQFWLALRDRALNTKAGTMDTQEAMVLDAWMGNLMGADQKLWSGNLNKKNVAARLAEGDPGTTPAYLAGVAKMREAAKKAGVEGAEAQEMAWSTAMALYEQASALGISAREVLQRGLLTDEVVAGTPDFATLLRDPEFATILGRDPQLAERLKLPTRTPRTAPEPLPMEAADERHLLRVADTLDELRAMRLTDTAVKTGRMPEDTLAGVVAAEAVTDDQWSSLLPHGSTPEGAREYWSPRIFAAGETLREQQGVLDAALGSGTGSRFRGTGSWTDDTGQLQINKLREEIDTLGPGDERQNLEQLLARLEADQLQENPVSSYGFRGQEIRGGGLPVKLERALRAARNILAGGTGPSTAAHVVLTPGVPRARHNAATIYAGRDLGRPAVSAFAADLRALNVAGSFVPVHSANSVRVLRLGDDFLPTPLSEFDEDSIRRLAARHFGTENAKGKMSEPRMETGENVAKEGYAEIAQDAEAGSGERVGRMVGKESDWAQLKPAVKNRMDTAVKAWATRLLNIYDMPRIRRERPDEARMLEILASTGASGLAKARESGVVLPALAALGFHLTPSGASGTVPQGEEA